MVRFNDLTFRVKFYAFVFINAVGLIAILVLAAYLLATYRVSGPIYERIISARTH